MASEINDTKIVFLNKNDIGGFLRVIKKSHDDLYLRAKIEFDSNSLSKKDLMEVLNKEGFLVGAIVDDQLVGTLALIKESPLVCRLRYLSVDPLFQGKHIASLMLEKAISFARENTYQFVVLSTNSKNKNAIHLYHKFGFIKLKKYAYKNRQIIKFLFGIDSSLLFRIKTHLKYIFSCIVFLLKK